MTGAMGNARLLLVLRLLGIVALMLALAVTSTGSVAAFDRDPAKEFGWPRLYDANNREPRGLWSDHTTMWVADDADDKLYAYDLDDKTRVSAKDFDGLKAAGNEDPAGIWSDGTTMWVADWVEDKVYAYLTGSRAWNPAQDFDTLRAAGNRDPVGIWSDGTTLWVADTGDDKIYAYNLATKARVPAQDFETLTAAGNRDPRGIWSDGVTMWVADIEDDKLYAYDLGTKARVPAREFETLQGAGNNDPTGIWSDGATVWVADYVDAGSWRQTGIYAYDMPEDTANVVPTDPIADPAAFDRDPAKEFGWPRLYDANNREPRGLWSDHTTMWVADDADDKLYAYDLDDKTRVSAKDFDGLKAAGNEDPAGIWSDGTTMWVADWVEDKVYAYLTGSRAWNPAQDFDTLRAAGNRDPVGIWSDGTTLWVADTGDDKIYAYNLATKARVPAQDFETLTAAGNRDPRGIWSDGVTMWVADIEDDKLYAYDLGTKARVPAREFETLQGAGNNDPTGIWSDGATVWVADYVDAGSWRQTGIYAYDMPEDTANVVPTDPIADPAAFDRDPAKEFGWPRLYDANNREPRGLWSDHTTMWVADDADDKLYAYDLDDKTRVSAKDFDGLKAAGNEDPAGIWSDGTTMWVADWVEDKVYAYLTGSRAWNPAQDFDTLRAAGNRDPVGIWSDGTTLWVADTGDDKIYAYNLATKARVPAQDFETLTAAGNRDPRGIWSDGVTMWVADIEDDKLYAYDLGTKARVPAREFETLQGAGNNDPTGIWSDGETMWVADYVDAGSWRQTEIYAYNMPPALPTTTPGAATISLVTPGVGFLTVSWLAPSGDASGITAYDLRHIPSGDDETVDANWTVVDNVWTGSGPLQETLTGLTGGTQYDVQVRAVNSIGDGPWSATATGTPTQSVGTGASATRSFSPATVAAGGQVVVAITAANYGGFGEVEETLPAGFTYVSSIFPDPVVSGQEVRFDLLGETSFTYTVTASDVDGTYTFSGTLTDSDNNVHTVGGDTTVTVGDALLDVSVSHAGMDPPAPVRIGTAIPVAASFTKAVTGFTVGDVTVVNGTAGNFLGSGAAYTFDVTPDDIGQVTVYIAANVAEDADGNGNGASEQLQLGIPYDDNRNGVIERSEVIKASRDYRRGDGSLKRSHVIALMRLYRSAGS